MFNNKKLVSIRFVREEEFPSLILVPANGDSPILIDSDSEEDFTSTEISEDEPEETSQTGKRERFFFRVIQ